MRTTPRTTPTATTPPTWPEPPKVPEPPRRTEPLHVPTVIRSAREACPAPGEHYACEVLEGVDAERWTEVLRERYTAGYRLAHVVPGADERTLLLFEHEH